MMRQCTVTFLSVVLLSVLFEGSAWSHRYRQSLRTIQKGKEQIRVLLLSMYDDVPNILDPRRHYSIIINHLLRVSHKIAQNCSADYNDVYLQEMPISIATGLKNVPGIISAVIAEHASFDNDVELIVSLIETICTDREENYVCNNKIEQIVKGDPVRYQQPAATLLVGGLIAENFLDARLLPVAINYREIAYLIDPSNIDLLEEMIYVIADRMRHHYPCDYF